MNNQLIDWAPTGGGWGVGGGQQLRGALLLIFHINQVEQGWVKKLPELKLDTFNHQD